MIFNDAKSVIEHLYALPNLHSKNDLSYIKKVLAELDNPQNKMKTIHITGTNGKGSTSYYLSNLLKKAGQRTGLFVSPYIREFNERIQVNGKDISDQDLVDLANQVEQAIDKIRIDVPGFSLVTFEYEVALAFLYFSKTYCDYAVIEVGIGGEHDKTNVINPEVSVITTVGLDHEKIIGPTINDIAKEKSGIIKPHCPVVVGNVPASVLPIIEKKANVEKSHIYQLNKDFTIKDRDQLEYSFANHSYVFNHRPKVEEYDIVIGVTAFLLLNIYLSKADVEKAINSTKVPGRYQIISEHPDIILDGAHNIQAMTNLLSFVKKEYCGQQIHVLITMMKDKDLDQVFELFDDDMDVVLTTISYPRAAKFPDFPKDVQEKYPYVEDFKTTYRSIKANLGPNDVLIVTGSFYLVSDILNLEDTDEG